MIRALIIDDEPLATEVIAGYLKSSQEIEVAGICHDGFEGIKMIREQKPELIFLDIRMPKINGFEMLELIDDPPLVIFTTAYDQYALQAFERHAVDYLLKPIEQQRLLDAIERAIGLLAGQEKLQQEKKRMETVHPELAAGPDEASRIVVKTGNDIRLVATSSISYIEAYDDHVKIFASGERYVKKRTLNHYEQLLKDHGFIRIHRSYLVQVASIMKLEGNGKEAFTCLLKNDVRVPVSRSGYQRLKETLHF